MISQHLSLYSMQLYCIQLYIMQVYVRIETSAIVNKIPTLLKHDSWLIYMLFCCFKIEI